MLLDRTALPLASPQQPQTLYRTKHTFSYSPFSLSLSLSLTFCLSSTVPVCAASRVMLMMSVESVLLGLVRLFCRPSITV